MRALTVRQPLGELDRLRSKDGRVAVLADRLSRPARDLRLSAVKDNSKNGQHAP
jgi:hypothetical protein